MIWVEVLRDERVLDAASYDLTDPAAIMELLRTYNASEFAWRIDYSHASLQEQRHWGLMEAMVRSAHAISAGERVSFGQQAYTEWPADAERLWADLRLVYAAGWRVRARLDDFGQVIEAYRDELLSDELIATLIEAEQNVIAPPGADD